MITHTKLQDGRRTIAQLLAVAFLAPLLAACNHQSPTAKAPEKFPFENPALSMEARAADLVSRMTLEEKVSQMQMAAPAIERLNVPAYDWWNEALHGVARNGAATVFPQAIGMAATWNTDLHFHMAQTIGIEARAKHEEALRQDIHARNTGLDLWAPNINIFRDPRWGRGQETYGEDPYLTGRFAVAYIKGIQGDDPRYFQAIATPKHFAVHSGPESERHRINNVVSERDLWSTYLPAFEAAIREGKAYSIMGAYNSLDGIPCCANPRLLTDILRKKWGFKGFVVSDVGAVADIYLNHQFSPDAESAAIAAVKAGCDLNGGTTYQALVAAVKGGAISEQLINQAVTRLMLARFRLGLFDPPGQVSYAQTPYADNDTAAHEHLALEVARESMVLLKNDHHALPLSKTLHTIAVIGPTADSVPALVGNYNGTPARPVTILQGIRNAVEPATRVIYAQGSPLVVEQLPLNEPVPAACLFTDSSRRTPGLKADYYTDFGLTARPFRTRIDPRVDFNWGLKSPRDLMPVADNFYVSWTGVLIPPASGVYQIGFSGAGAFRLTIDDQVVVDDWTVSGRHSIGGRIALKKDTPYAIQAEYYHGNDDATVQLRWTRPEAEPFYADAVRAAEQSDAVIMVLGLTSSLEREQDTTAYQGFSGGDRQTLELPQVQQELLHAVCATGKPVTLVLTGGSCLAINWANAHVPAILEAWYPGEQGGNAVADVLFGDYNPAGRLPVTFYKSIDDLPDFEDYSMVGRTYRYFHGTPLFPFGYGLSYTTFAYDALDAPATQSTTENLTVRATVRNTGALAGDEVVQLYVSRPVKNQDDPIRCLQGFLRVHLKPGESRQIEFTLTPRQLSVVDDNGRRHTEPGEITLQVGPDSAHGITRTVALKGGSVEPEYRYIPPKIIAAPASRLPYHVRGPHNPSSKSTASSQSSGTANSLTSG